MRAIENKRAVVALASCFFGLGMIFFGFRMGFKSPEKKSAEEKTKAAQAKPKKSQPAWNLALGNVVVLAPELGFDVKALKDEPVDPTKIAGRIESQLLGLRELYRHESEQNPSLLGGILLQFVVNASGEVTQVKELVSRLPDGDFKKALLDQVSRWDFSQVVSSPVIVNCPLMLVREGMDITTLVNWEKTLGLFEEKSAAARVHVQGNEKANRAEGQKPAANRLKPISDPSPRQQKSPVQSNNNLFEIRSTTPIRKEPSYRSPSISQANKGMKFNAVSVQGEWLEIRTDGSSGFIRREFATPIE